MKLTDNEKTVIADLGINHDYQEHPVETAQTVRKILGNGLAGAKSVIRSLEKKGVLETIGEGEDELTQFTERGIEEALKLNPVEEDDAPEDDVPEDGLEEMIEVDLDEDDDEDDAPTMVKQAAKKALKAAAKKDSKKSPGATRTSHAGCAHESSKAARAKCRKERAAAAAKA